MCFFKARDKDALEAAFAEYTARTMQRKKDKPSIAAQLQHFKEVVKNRQRDTEKHREQGSIER